MENIRVMLVDDEERFLRTTKKLLSRRGYDVATATSGMQALREIKKLKSGIEVIQSA